MKKEANNSWITPPISSLVSFQRHLLVGVVITSNVAKKMSSWRPIAEGELWDLINRAWDEMTPLQRRLWEVIKIDPVKWQENSYGALGGGFWVVAIYGSTVIWFNDIEDGFNRSTWSTPGTIDEYWCNQDKLQWTVQHVLDQWRDGFSSGARCGPPEPIA
jgi:hypothetical protein